MADEELSDLAVARRAARRGGRAALKSFRTDLPIDTKRSKTDFVTQADRDAQAAIVGAITSHRSDDTIVAEEDGQRSTLPAEGRAWVIDPIDGTGNFARGGVLWTTSITLVDADAPLASVNYMPAVGDRFEAADAARINAGVLRVSQRNDPETFAVAAMMGWGFASPDGVGTACAELLGALGELYRFRSGQTALSMVAAGHLDAGVTFNTGAAWDRIAGVHLVRAAGGIATDLGGDPWTMSADGLVVSNGQCHDRLLEIVATIRERVES